MDSNNVIALSPPLPGPVEILMELADLAYSFGDPQGCIDAINDLYALFDVAEA